jgi:hypothetical protein
MDQNERRKMAANGVFRIKNGTGEDGVWIRAGQLAFELPESRYREGRYQPSLETLPWGKAPEQPAGHDIGSGDIASLPHGPSTDDDQPLE